MYRICLSDSIVSGLNNLLNFIIKGFECGGHNIPGGLSCNANTRIVGGVTSKSGEWPWIVKLDVSIDGYLYDCGGTIIDDEWILSAAHCFVGRVVHRVSAVSRKISNEQFWIKSKTVKYVKFRNVF